jgi:hypothetical protein
MMPTIDISTETNARLQKIAKPLVDTYDTVIKRLLDLQETTGAIKPDERAGPGTPLSDDGRMMVFDWRNPPSLKHTSVIEASFQGERIDRSACYWNNIMMRVIVAARKAGKSSDELFTMLFVNRDKGQKSDHGYKYVGEIGFSVQGQDSQAAFRQAYDLAEKMGFKLDVTFRWQSKEDAAFPNRQGRVSI